MANFLVAVEERMRYLVPVTALDQEDAERKAIIELCEASEPNMYFDNRSGGFVAIEAELVGDSRG
ncbi:hypothetical protein ABZ714_13135 [Streptomyces sp. NPDC006798]|uniref:hypothetical protein n=1 Tax=Streptomyces sp. NPDC006798 TaxID=3155462 RepID=UPI0033FF8DF0